MQQIISEIADIVRELSRSGEPYFQLFIISPWRKVGQTRQGPCFCKTEPLLEGDGGGGGVT